MFFFSFRSSGFWTQSNISYSEFLQMFLGANARQHEDVRRTNSTSWQDDFLPGWHSLESTILHIFNSNCSLAFEQNLQETMCPKGLTLPCSLQWYPLESSILQYHCSETVSSVFPKSLFCQCKWLVLQFFHFSQKLSFGQIFCWCSVLGFLSFWIFFQLFHAIKFDCGKMPNLWILHFSKAVRKTTTNFFFLKNNKFVHQPKKKTEILWKQSQNSDTGEKEPPSHPTLSNIV